MKPRIPNRFVRTLGPLTSAVFLMATAASQAQSSTWGGATSSDWTVAGNWTLNPPAYGSTSTGRLDVNTAVNPAIYDPVGQSAASTTTTFTGAANARGLVIGSITPGALTIKSGTLAIGGTSNPVMSNAASGTLLISGGKLDLSANALDFQLVLGGGATVVSTVTLSGTGELVANGIDLVTSNTASTQAVNLNGGTISAKFFKRTATVGTSAISFNGGALKALQSSAAFFPAMAATTTTVAAGGGMIDTQTFNITVAAPLLHDPALGATLDGGLIKNGSGILTLTGTSTYTGPTTINAGSLVLPTTGNLPSSTLALATGTSLQLDSAGKTFGGLTLNPGASLSLVATSGSTNTLTGPLTLNGGSIPVTIVPGSALTTGSVIDLFTAASVSGSATFTPTFPAGSRITGTTAVSGNKLQFSIATGTANLVWNSTPTGLWELDGAPNFKNGPANDVFKNLDTVTFDNTPGAGANTVTVNTTVSPGGITVANSTGDYLFDGTGTITGPGGLTKTGTSNLTLGGTLVYSATGPITLSGTGTVNLGGKTLTGAGPLTLDDATLSNGNVAASSFAIHSGTSTAIFSGAGALTKSTAGTATLGGVSTYTGGNTLSEGTLIVTNAGGLGAGASTLTGGTLNLDVNYNLRGMNLNGGLLSVKRGTTLNADLGLRFNSNTSTITPYGTGANPILRGNDVNSPDITVADTISAVIPATFDVRTTGFGLAITTTGSGALTIEGGISSNGNSSNSIGMSGLWEGTDSGALFKLGTGTLTLTGASTFTGTLTSPGANVGSSTIQAGTLVLSGGDDRLPVTSAMYLGIGTTGAKMVLGGINQTLTGLKSVGTGSSSVVGGSATASTLTLNTTNNYTFAGPIGGAGLNEDNLALVKGGAGTLTLSGTNQYRGDTTVNGGVLALGTATLADASKVTIAPTAKLALNYTGTDTVAQLVIGINSLPAGVYGSVASGAANPDDTHFSGTGTITVLPPTGDYDVWATDKQLTAGNSGKGQDADDDGVNNFGEFAFAGEPLSAVANPRIVQKIATVNSQRVLTLTLPVRNGVRFDGTTELVSLGSVSGVYYRIQGSTDLVTWNTLNVDEVPALDTAAVQTDIDDAPLGWTNRSFYLPDVAPANAAKSFLRAKASETP